MEECKPLVEGDGAVQPGAHLKGKAVLVDPIKPTLKAPGAKRLKLKYDEMLSIFAVKFNLRRATPRVANSWYWSVTTSSCRPRWGATLYDKVSEAMTELIELS